MNRRSLLRFLALAPFAAPVAIIAARATTASTTWGAGIPATLSAWDAMDGPLKPGDVAKFMKASRKILDEAPTLRSYIDSRLNYAVERA